METRTPEATPLDGRASRARTLILLLMLVLITAPVIAFLAFGTHAAPRQ